MDAAQLIRDPGADRIAETQIVPRLAPLILTKDQGQARNLGRKGTGRDMDRPTPTGGSITGAEIT
jgi:hypothetical protein